MRPTLAIIALILCSGCEIVSERVITTHYNSDIWQTVKVTPPPASARHLPKNHPNYIAISQTSGNHEYLLADSIQNENGMISAIVEYHYAKPQTLPNTGATYHYNRWLEHIDCIHQIRTIRRTTHYNAENQIVDANEYPVPTYTPEQLALMAQPNDKVIKEVCQRVGIVQQGTDNRKAGNTQPETFAKPPDLSAVQSASIG